MGDIEAEEIPGTLISGPGLTPHGQARHSALFVAVDIAKQIPADPRETVESRVKAVLSAAEQVYPWLLAPEPTHAAA